VKKDGSLSYFYQGREIPLELVPTALILQAVPGKITFKKGKVYIAQRDHGGIVRVKCLRGGKDPIFHAGSDAAAFSLRGYLWIMEEPKVS
jgi:hypothetical protein